MAGTGFYKGSFVRISFDPHMKRPKLVSSEQCINCGLFVPLPCCSFWFVSAGIGISMVSSNGASLVEHLGLFPGTDGL